MKKTLTHINLTLLCLLSAVCWLKAQINDNSPFPADFVVNSPSSIAGVYDYAAQVNSGAAGEWGPRLSETLTADLVWAYDDTDSLACNPVTTDLTGKIALIRRGVCNFSLKVYNAQEAGAVGAIICNHYSDPAQDGSSLVGMQAADTAFTVTIPAIFVGRTTCEIIQSELDAGNPVNVSFRVKTFYNPVTSYSWHTPQSQIIPIDVFRINLINPDSANSVDAVVNMEITDPDNNTVNFTTTSSIGPLGDSVVVFTDTYMPDEIGHYTVKFTNSLNDEEVISGFEITEHTYSPDDGNLTGSVGPDSLRFTTTFGFNHSAASLVITGPTGGIFPYMSFGLGNPQELFASGENITFQIRLFDADANDDNIIDLSNSFDDLTTVLAGVDYTLNGTEQPNEFIVIEMESFIGDVVELEPNHPYYIAVLYNGLEAAIGIAPRYTRSQEVTYLNFPTTAIYLDQLYTGWDGSTIAIRLHEDGFLTSGTDDVTLLDDSKINVHPNPAGQFVMLELSLAKQADEVKAGILDLTGQVVRVEKFENVKDGSFRLDVSDLAPGTYFLSVITPEGWRSKKVVVVR